MTTEPMDGSDSRAQSTTTAPTAAGTTPAQSLAPATARSTRSQFMTTVLIDAGNTRVKFGLRRDRDYVAVPAPREPAQAAFGYDDVDGIAAWLDGIGGSIASALGTNVAGARVQDMLDGLLAARGAAIQWQTATPSCLGLVNGYLEPTRLGPDRWLGMVGIWACAQRPAFLTTAPAPTVHLLAHFGTATTLDTIDAEGRFLGGLILPGRDLMRRSLAVGTANLPSADGHIEAFPGNTHDAIATGVASAQAGAVARQWLAVRDRHGQPPLLHVSGGAWLSIATEVQHLLAAIGSTQIIRVVDNPVLDGLACVAEAASPSAVRPI